MKKGSRQNGSSLVFSVSELVEAIGGQLVSDSSEIKVQGFSIDSRRVRVGDLFFAIQGERFDGHQFVEEAVKRGAVGVVISDVSSLKSEIGVAKEPFVIVVRDTIRALQLLGLFVRRASRARVVAITGSVGKTTTKELSAALLESQHHVFRSKGNLNNHIGLPLSLLELRHLPDIAIVELGMNHPGEIGTLVRIAEPEIRVWTNVAEVHSEFFDSVEAIADAKAELLDSATSETQLIVNAADPRVMARTSGFPGQMFTFGIGVDANVRATDLRALGLSGMAMKIHTPVGSAELRTPLLGRGNIANILAAISVALQFQVPLDVLLSRVNEFKSPPKRGEIIRLSGVTIVDDSYNSNPVALKCALEAIGQESKVTRRVAVLGEMLELGRRSQALHEACGRAAVESGFDIVVAVGGDAAGSLADGAISAGLTSSAVMTFKTSDEAADCTCKLIQNGDLVLIKGSRGIETERIIDRLKIELS